jgi:NitT/TauT family transport system substrate-binding protein
MNTNRLLSGARLLAALFALLLLAAACGGEGDTAGTGAGTGAGTDAGTDAGTADTQTTDAGTTETAGTGTAGTETGGGTETAGATETGAAGECETTDQVSLQLKWVAQAQFAGYFAADDQGFYADNCLEVEILEGGPDVGPAQVVAGGGADFGIDWLASTLAQRAAGEDFVNIAQVFQRSAIMQVSWADSGITEIADLDGKTVGVWGFGNEYEPLAALKAAGLDPDTDVELVDQPFDMNLLLNREIDSASATTYNEYAQLLEAENPDTGELNQPEDFSVILMDDAGTAMYQDGIFAQSSYVEENPDITARFVEASLRGWIFCRDNPEDCVQITFDRGSILGQGHQRWMMNEVNKLIWPSPEGIGMMVEQGYQRTAEIAAESIDEITEVPGPDAYTTEFVEQALSNIEEDTTGEDWQAEEVEVTPGGE